jgi:biopolymer transport protein ExbD
MLVGMMLSSFRAGPAGILIASLLASSGLFACGGSERCPETPKSSAADAPTSPSGKQAPNQQINGGNTVDVTPASGDAIFHVQIAKDGKLAIEGQRLDDPRELSNRVRASVKVRPELQVVIAGDREVPYAHVMNAIDLVKQGGVSRVSFSFENVGASVAQPAQAPPLKSAPTLEGGAWKCEIKEHIANLDKLSALVAIHVGPDGVVQTVEVLDDPGQGLGEAAKSCAFNQRFRPAVDMSGKPTAGLLKLKVTFQGHQH